MLQLLPVIEDGALADCAPPSDTQGWIVLSADTPDEQIARVVATIAGYGRPIGVQETPQATITAILDAPQFVVGGGLLLRVGDFEPAPGCCCGLEGWREWRA